MKQEDLFQAMSGIDESLLQETETRRARGKKRRRQIRLLCCLAVLVLAGTGASVAFLNSNSLPVSPPESEVSAPPSPSPSGSPGKGVTIPQAEPPVGFNPATTSFLCPFFWVDGRQYDSFVSVPYSESLIGKRLGTVEMRVYDVGPLELLPPSEQETLSYQTALGCVAGDFCEVSGYSPEFLLCMPGQENLDEGKLRLFFSGSGQTFYTGEDLFQKFLSARGRVTSVQAEMQKESEFEVQRFSVPIEEDFTPFLEALCSAPAVPETKVSGESLLGTLSVQLEDGVAFLLDLYSNSYVTFAGIHGVAFQMDDELFDHWVKFCQ